MENAVTETGKNLAASAHNGNGSHTTHAMKRPPSLMSTQLCDELIRILKTGDEKNDGAFTVAIAAQVEKFVIAAREILMTEHLAQQDLGSLMMMRKQHPGGPWGSIVGGVGGSLGTDGYNSGYPLPYQSPINNENFGVQAIRQLVDSIRSIGESPAKLVEAIAAARSNNLPDVVASLEKKLGISKDATTGEDAHEGPAS